MTVNPNAGAVNPNKALWEKGDFTRIAESMRESGEALVTASRLAGAVRSCRPRVHWFSAPLFAALVGPIPVGP
jgi:hypothetical protein